MTGRDAFNELNEAVAKLKAAGYTEEVILEMIADMEKMKKQATLKPDELAELEETIGGYYEIAGLFALQRIGGLMGQLSQKVDELRQRSQQQPEQPDG